MKYETELTRYNLLLKGQSILVNQKTDTALLRWVKEKKLDVLIDRRSIWGNPFELGKDGNRDEVCDAYAMYFGLKKSLQSKLLTLHSKALLCWCYPNRCHGNHLLTLLKNTPRQQNLFNELDGI